MRIDRRARQCRVAMAGTQGPQSAQKALQRIVDDGLRAAEFITSIRGMFRKDSHEKLELSVNDLVREVLKLIHGDLERRQIILQTELHNALPKITGERVPLQQAPLVMQRRLLLELRRPGARLALEQVLAARIARGCIRPAATLSAGSSHGPLDARYISSLRRDGSTLTRDVAV
jgi:signal transduction histidine kinase